MFGKVPAYTDISHFRAPYKNAMIAGYGQEPATPPPGGNAEAQFVTEKDGYRYVNPKLGPMLLQILAGYNATFLGGAMRQAKITPYTVEMINASNTQPEILAYNAKNWIESEVKMGNVVLMSMSTLISITQSIPLTDANDKIISYKAGTPEAKAAAKSPMGVVIAGDPAGGMSYAMIGGVVVVAALAAGGVYYLATRKKY